MISIDLATAYAEACREIGELRVRERLLTAELQRLQQQVEPPPESAP